MGEGDGQAMHCPDVMRALEVLLISKPGQLEYVACHRVIPSLTFMAANISLEGIFLESRPSAISISIMFGLLRLCLDYSGTAH
jgi:hypothetical protein